MTEDPKNHPFPYGNPLKKISSFNNRHKKTEIVKGNVPLYDVNYILEQSLTCCEEESSHFAFSAASLNLCKAIVSLFTSIPKSDINSVKRLYLVMLTLPKVCCNKSRGLSTSDRFSRKEIFKIQA